MRTKTYLTWTIAVSIVLIGAMHVGASETWRVTQREATLAGEPEAFPDVERFLVPVYAWNGFPGRFGAFWVAELWIRNSTDENVVFGFGDLRVVLPGGGWAQIGPRAAGPYSSGRAERGAIYVVDEAWAEEVHLSLRIADVSRRPISHGTEVPIVRERDWISRPVELLDVPVDFAVRQTLRAYEPDGTNETAVRVIVYPAREDETIADVVLEPRGGRRFFEGVHSGAPAYAEISDLVEAFPQIAAHDRVRIRIEPLTPGMRYWAFVTITDNMTQQVTVVSPQ